METIVTTFTQEKETKNTIRFQEDKIDGKPPFVGSLYIQSWAVGSLPGRRVKVTIEEA